MFYLCLNFDYLVFTILNAAPADENLENEFYTLSDIFCVNETEVGMWYSTINFLNFVYWCFLQAEILIKQPVTNHDEALFAAHKLMEKGILIISQGGRTNNNKNKWRL